MSLKKKVSVKCSEVSKKGDGTSTLEDREGFMEQGALEPSLKVGRQDLPSLERTCNVEETMRE